MIEVNFKDRIPREPGQVTLTPVAGAVNTYILERNDDPSEFGTPLNKATFNSIIQSRLTGRYYTPSVTRSLNKTVEDLTASPIPTSGWIYDDGNEKRATNGGYVVTVDSHYNTSWRAANAFTSSGWRSVAEVNPWLVIEHAQVIHVKNIRLSIEFGFPDLFAKLEFQGSNDGVEWEGLGEISSVTSTATIAYRLGNPGDYRFYRLYFTSTDENSVTVKNLSYSLYDVNTYKNELTVAEAPPYWTQNQIIFVQMPSGFSQIAVDANSLNGVSVNTILQPLKRYELRYTGTAFVAKEV